MFIFIFFYLKSIDRRYSGPKLLILIFFAVHSQLQLVNDVQQIQLCYVELECVILVLEPLL